MVCWPEWRVLDAENTSQKKRRRFSSSSSQVSNRPPALISRSRLHLIRTVTVRNFEAFAPLVMAWDRLAWEAPQQIPILLPDFVEATLHHRLAPKESWFCSFAYAGDRLVGVLPVIIAPHAALGRCWPRLRVAFDEHAPCGDALLAPDCAREALRALLAEVTREIPHSRSLEFTAVRQSSPTWYVLHDGLEGHLLHLRPHWKHSCLAVRGECDRYFAGLGKMRRNLRIGRQKLEKHGTISVELRKGPAAGADFLAEFLALEASGWKGRTGTAILKNPNLVTFYTRLVERFAAKGRLEWHVIRVEGRLVAAQMAFRCGASLMLPKYAYDEEFAECMPGHLLIEEVIREAFSRPEIAELNPMSDSPQHRLFHMPRDEYHNVLLVRRTALSAFLHRTRQAIRSVYRTHVRPHMPSVRKRRSPR